MQTIAVKDMRKKYSDYAKLDDGNRYELINGVLSVMEPGAAQAHQGVNGELFRQLANYLLDSPCKVFHPPFDVCLNACGDDDTTVVQPDVVIVCDPSKLDGKRCNGAPDMIIEILSPLSARRDMLVKFNNYMKAGVREYWIVDPKDKMVRVCILINGKYDFNDYIDVELLPVSVLEGCEIDMKRVFDQ